MTRKVMAQHQDHRGPICTGLSDMEVEKQREGYAMLSVAVAMTAEQHSSGMPSAACVVPLFYFP